MLVEGATAVRVALFARGAGVLTPLGPALCKTGRSKEVTAIVCPVLRVSTADVEDDFV